LEETPNIGVSSTREVIHIETLCRNQKTTEAAPPQATLGPATASGRDGFGDRQAILVDVVAGD
jgi:hypothetical protein